MNKRIKEYINHFFNWLEIQITSLDITEENWNFYFVKLISEDSSLLIWKHWNTIDSLQRILSMCINSFSDEETKIKLKLEINDYCKSYEDKLFSRIDSVVNILRNTKTEYDLWKLSSYDRKRIHSYVAKKYEDIISKSRWEWENRRIFLLLKDYKNLEIKVKPKTKLTIDIDGNNI